MTYYLDGSNICFWRDKNNFSLVILLNICNELKKNGHDFICFFDANAVYLPKDNNEITVIKELLKDKQKYKTSPAGMKADDFILLSADKSKASIISNDRYKDYISQFKWLEPGNTPTRLIKGMVNAENDGEYLMIPTLKINSLIESNILTLFNKFNSITNKQTNFNNQQKNQNTMATEFKPTGVKVPKVFHQLGILVLDGSGSMTEKGPSNTTKANHVSSAVIELFNRVCSQTKVNFLLDSVS